MIVPMKKMLLFAHTSDEEAILKRLQDLGAVEIIPPDDTMSAVSMNQSLFEEYDEKLRHLKSAADCIIPYSKKSGLLIPLPEITQSEYESAQMRQEAFDAADEILNISARIDELKRQIKEIGTKEDVLSLWSYLKIPVEDIKSGKKTRITAGFVPLEKVDFLSDSGIAVSFIDTQSPKLVPCIVAYHKKETDDVQKILRQADFTEFVFDKSYRGYVKDILQDLKKQKEELEKQKDAETAKLKALADKKQLVLSQTDSLHSEQDRVYAMADILRSKKAFMLEGWVKATDTDRIREETEKVTDAYYIEFNDPTEGEVPPTVVLNTSVVEPFETIVDMYSKPSYKGIDAAPLITPFYALFFGMMLGDVGYGLVLFLGCLLFDKIKKPSGGMRGLVRVFKWSGLATVVCGLMFGTFFGMDMDTIFGTTNVFPLVLDPMVDSTTMLILCCGMGVVHMIFGLCVKIYMCMREGDVQSAIYDNLSWIMIILGIVGFAFLPSVFKTPCILVAILGALLLVVFGGRNKKGIMKYIGGIASLYNITGWLSDVVSYARIFAIGLVGGAMGQVFNTIGVMVAGACSGFGKVISVLCAVILIVAMHAFGLAINVLSAFSHTARLQYVEFFGKFYEDGGRAFSPLTRTSKSVRIKDDKN